MQKQKFSDFSVVDTTDILSRVHAGRILKNRFFRSVHMVYSTCPPGPIYAKISRNGREMSSVRRLRRFGLWNPILALSALPCDPLALRPNRALPNTSQSFLDTQ